MTFWDFAAKNPFLFWLSIAVAGFFLLLFLEAAWKNYLTYKMHSDLLRSKKEKDK